MGITLFTDKNATLITDYCHTFVAPASASLAMSFRRIGNLELQDDRLTFLRLRILHFGVRLQHLRATLWKRLTRDIFNENKLGLRRCLLFRLLRYVFDGIHMFIGETETPLDYHV